MTSSQEIPPSVRTTFEYNSRSAAELKRAKQHIWDRFQKTIDEVTWAEIELMRDEAEAAMIEARANLELAKRRAGDYPSQSQADDAQRLLQQQQRQRRRQGQR
jgi:hypothetical protein